MYGSLISNLWLYGSLISNYLCNQCLSPLILWVRTLLRRGVLDTALCDKVCQWLATGQWFSLGTPVSSTNKPDCHDITEILLKVALSTIDLSQPIETWFIYHSNFIITTTKTKKSWQFDVFFFVFEMYNTIMVCLNKRPWYKCIFNWYNQTL